MYYASASKMLQVLLKEPEYNECLKMAVRRYKLQKNDVKNCSSNISDRLEKYNEFGNTMEELTVYDSQHSITEVATIESLFCALKKKNSFHFPLRIVAK